MAAFFAWLPEQLGKPVALVEVTPFDVQKYRDHLVDEGRKPAGVNRVLAAKKRGRDWFLDKVEVLAYAQAMKELEPGKYNPWREELEEQGRGRRQDEDDGAG